MKPTVINKREKQKMERRWQILDCALDMIISRGFEATKIRDIAKKLGISTGLFFNYFESKDKLYEELVKMGLIGPAKALEFNTDEAEPIEVFEKITLYIFKAIKEYSFTAKMFIFMTQTMKREAVPENVKKLLSGFNVVTPLIPVVRKGQEKGQIKEGNPESLIFAFWSAVQGIAEYSVLWPDVPLPESEWIVDIIRK